MAQTVQCLCRKYDRRSRDSVDIRKRIDKMGAEIDYRVRYWCQRHIYVFTRFMFGGRFSCFGHVTTDQ